MLHERAKKPLRNISCILALGVIGIIVVLALIWSDVPQTDNAKALTMFFLLGFGGLTVVSLLGIAYVLVQNAVLNRYPHIADRRQERGLR